MWKRVCSIIVVVCLFCSEMAGQKLAFQNFSTGNGLLQAQVFCITQDQQHHLWLGTASGMDRFDGSVFKHFTKSEGLNSSIIYSLHTDPNGIIWASTPKGISCYNGHRIINYPDTLGPSSISSDKKGNIWAYRNKKGLFKFLRNQFVPVPNPFANVEATCLYKDANGDLLVHFYPKGVYKLTENSWARLADIPANGNEKLNRLLGANACWYATTNATINKYSAGALVSSVTIEEGPINSICADKKGNIWMATKKGAWVLNGNDLSVMAKHTAVTGFSDNSVESLFCDIEGNMWIGTSGDGLFKFSDGSFGHYDKSNGLPGDFVMGLVRKKNDNLLIATRDGGMVAYDINTKKISPFDLAPTGNDAVICVTLAKNGLLYLSKVNNGTMVYNQGKWQKIKLNKSGKEPLVDAIVCEEDKTWFAATDGCYYQQNGTVQKVGGINKLTFCVLPLPNNETLIGAYDGLYVYKGSGNAQKIDIPQLKDIFVLCLVKHGPYILIGTMDDGVFFWDRRTNKLFNCNAANGLSDNRAFSILVDRKENIWVAAGTSVQYIKFSGIPERFEITRFSAADGYEKSESNLNAIMEDKDGCIWIGTTNGVFVYNGNAPAKDSIGPYVVIQQVGLADSSLRTNETEPWYGLPKDLVLPYSKNSINFSVKGILLKHPESVRYACQLVGYDQDFSSIVDQTFFNYQNLEPGNYVFRVKAYTASGLPSKNIAEFPFTVATPFYKTRLFLGLIVLALLLTGAVAQFLVMRSKIRRRKQQALIRLEEQQAIRLRTSEDFHDELGNKLTRISLLTDILQQKTGTEDLEKNRLLLQIKENVLALYAGTKDIIWSLSAGSDGLKETLLRIEQFGEELFHGTTIAFEMQGIDTIDAATVLPMDYSRNILMVFKESLNNSLKHAQCSHIKITVQTIDNNSIRIRQTDNGNGFEEALVQKGNGLNNIFRRAKRINAQLTIHTSPSNGTSIDLLLKIPPKG